MPERQKANGGGRVGPETGRRALAVASAGDCLRGWPEGVGTQGRTWVSTLRLTLRQKLFFPSYVHYIFNVTVNVGSPSITLSFLVFLLFVLRSLVFLRSRVSFVSSCMFVAVSDLKLILQL